MNAIVALYFGVLLGGNVIANPENVDETPLISAIRKGGVAQVESLIKSGANVNEKEEEDGYAPLHVSAENGFESISKILIDNGAIIDIQDNDGATPLQLAVSNRKLATAELLIKAGAETGDINAEFINETPLHVALQSGDLEFAQQLIENGADVNAVMTVNITGITIQAFTPLQRLLANPFSPTRKVVELLIEYGADVNAVPLDDVSNSPLHLAIEKERDDSVIELLIEKGATVNQKQKFMGRTPLHQAVMYGRRNVVKCLIRAGACLNATDYLSNTPLHLVDGLDSRRHKNNFNSTVEDFYAIAVLLINNGANVNAKNYKGNRPLDETNNEKDDTDRVIYLIKDGANVNEKEEDNGFAPLHFSAGAGLERMTKILIYNGADANIRSNKGKTPLEMATINGQVKTAELLIEAGANIDSTNDDGASILHEIIRTIWYAKPGDQYVTYFLNASKVDRSSQEKAFALLLQNGADVNKICENYDNITPLQLALIAGEDEIAELLIEHGAEINTVYWRGFDRTGYSPFHCIFMKSLAPSHKIIDLLIKHGADINAVSLNDDGFTPLHYAVFAAHDANIIEFLIEKGAAVNHATKAGETALHLATKSGRLKIVESLIRAGALVNATDRDSNTPLHLIKLMKENRYFATDGDYFAICELLIANGADAHAKDVNGKTPLDVIPNAKIKLLLKEKMDQLNHIYN